MSNTQGQVTLPNTEVHLLQSSHVDQEYKLLISLPDGYTESEDTYPVVYVTDATWFFSIFHSFVRFLPIPSMIVVGISYPPEATVDPASLRARDFLPTKNIEEENERSALKKYRIESGGGSNFLLFIREELLPLIESHYRTKADDRTLWCYSFGGTFGLYTLFKHPDTFNRYIVGAPDLRWDNRVCFAYEREYAEQATDLAAKLYLCVGTLDQDRHDQNASHLFEFHEILKRRNYASLDMEFEVFRGETHLTGILPSISWGLRSVFG